LPYSQQSKLQHLSLPSDAAPVDVELAGERFVGTTAQLAPQVQLLVLKSIDQATAFLSELNRILLGLGLIALGAGSIFVFLLSDKFTKPLQDLVAAVRALGRGDYSYPLNPVSGDEIAEVSVNFDRMRESLQASQRRLLEAERLVTIGQMASSISHDLRHQLVAIVANAEYLADPKTGTDARQELYDEIRFAVNQMTDLVESLLEFSRTRESLRPTHADLKEILEHAVKTVRLHPEFQHINIEVNAADNSEGWFDCPKLERVFQNLLRNACAAVDAGGVVTISAQRQKHSFAIRIADNGRGIPQDIQAKIFEPFFSYGKESGTGLGLAVAQKIAQDHGGELRLERSSELGTVFVVRLPAGPPLPSTSNVSHSAVS
jgi:signal transduction histidine kinase